MNTEKQMKVSLVIFIFILVAFNESVAQISIEQMDKRYSTVGERVALTGKNFNSVASQNEVFFGSVKAQVIAVHNNSVIELYTPAGATYDNISILDKSTGKYAYSQNPFFLSFGGSDLEIDNLEDPSSFFASAGLRDFCLCDFNSDGLSDVVTANSSANVINVFTNRSTPGNFQFDASTIDDVNAPTLNVRCADINGDGKQDVIVSKGGSAGDRILIFENTTTGSTVTFAAGRFILLSTNRAGKIEVSDMDLDGRPDIIVAHQDNRQISILRNTGNFSFNISTVEITNTAVTGVLGLKVQDINNDDLPEIIAGAFQAANVYIFKNVSNPGTMAFSASQTLEIPGNLVDVKTADVDFDGNQDIVVTKLLTSEISILLGQAGDDLTFAAEQKFNVGERPWGVSFGDLNGDSKVDIAVGSIDDANQRLIFFENNSTPGQIQLERKDKSLTAKNRNVLIGDMDGDAKPDVVFTNIDFNTIDILRNSHCVIPEIQPNESINSCTGFELTLEATKANDVNYIWYKNNVEAAQGPGSSYTESLSNGTYFFHVEVVGENGTCINASEPLEVVIENGTLPVEPAINNPGVACAGENFILTATGANPAGNYHWRLPNNTIVEGEQLVINDIQASDIGFYRLYIEEDGCRSQEVETFINVNLPPEVQMSEAAINACVGESVTIGVRNVPAWDYQWFKDGSEVSGSEDYDINITEPGSYSVRVTDENGCTTTSEGVVVDYFEIAEANFTAPVTVCAGEEFTLENTSNFDNNAEVTYLWDFGGQSTSDETSPSLSFSEANTYTITLTISYDQASCGDSFSQTIEVIDAPEVQITSNGGDSFCEGEQLLLALDASYESVVWSNGLASNEITISEGGNYSVEVTNEAGCIGEAEIDITRFQAPLIQIAPENPEILLGDEIQLTASGAQDYVWAPEAGLSEVNIPDPIASPEATTTYTVTGTDINGCTGEAEVTVTVNLEPVVPTPKAFFTPNGDAHNDIWVINNLQGYNSCMVNIFNESGIRIFEEDYLQKQWDGTVNGQPLMEGVYFYVINCDDKVSKKGSVTLIK